MSYKLLLLKDVEKLGRKGEIVTAAPGYARNYLIPQHYALRADNNALRMQARLQEERAKQAAADRADAEKLAQLLDGKVYSTSVKVDPEGHMYGSVTATDLIKLLEEDGITLDKRAIQLKQAIKSLGVHQIQLKLKEGVEAKFVLKILVEGQEDVVEKEDEVPQFIEKKIKSA